MRTFGHLEILQQLIGPFLEVTEGHVFDNLGKLLYFLLVFHDLFNLVHELVDVKLQD